MTEPANLRRFWRVSFFLVAASMLSNVLLYLFHMITARLVTPATYASIQALLGLTMVVSVPLQIISLTLSKLVTALDTRGDHIELARLARGWLRRMLAIGALVSGVGILAAPYLARTLNIAAPVAVACMTLLFVSNILQVSLFAIIEGRLQFARVAWLWVFGTGLRLVLGVSAALLGYQIDGVFGGILAAALCTTCVSYVWAMSGLPSTTHLSPHTPTLRPSPIMVNALFTNLALALLTQLDVVYVNRFFPADVAGGYAICSMVGKLLIYVPTTLVTGMYPLVNATLAHGQQTRQFLQRALLLTLLLSGCGGLVLAMAPHFFLKLLFGATLAARGEMWLRPALLAFAPYSVITLLGNYFVAHEHKLFGRIFMGCAVVAVVAALYLPHSVQHLLNVMTLTGLFALFVAAVSFRVHKH